jgi:nitric oxide reductase NorD protein
MSSPPHSSDAQSAPSGAPLSLNEIAIVLERLLDPVLSARRTAAPLAQGIAARSRAEQDFVLHWVTVIARTNIELAFQFAAAAPDALDTLDAGAAKEWVIHAMDTYDREGLHRGGEILRQPRSFVPDAAAPQAVKFQDVARVIQLFVHGLSGRPLRIDAALRSYTDTAAIYLPTRISRGASAEDNFFLYKATAALLWAQSRYGTFNADLRESCRPFPDPARALALLNALETVRLEAHIALTLPGLARNMAALRRGRPLDSRLEPILAPSATVHDSIALLRVLYDTPPALDDPYETVLEPAHAAAARADRIARDKNELQAALKRLLENEIQDRAPRDGESLALELVADSNEIAYVLRIEGEPVVLSPELNRLIDSIVTDMDGVPEDYLALPGPAAAASAETETKASAHDVREAPTYFYNEWDCRRRHYRKNWCVVRELEVNGEDPAFVERTLARYAPRVAELKRTFEMMRGEERLLKRQQDGDGIDFDALVDAYGDMRAGAELSSLLFTKRRKHERDLAVMFMVDMSGSTKGWINEAEREALVMLCEALEVLGDRYAIYGFSGMTRRRCEIFRVKRFDERYGPVVRARISGIEPQDYTRMGAAIRHLTMLLAGVQARTKLLITLSDGKPDDYSDEYRGEYGIEDTRQALIEAHRAGVKPFCITIDREARDYLPHMYGSVNWTLIDDVSRLPLKVAEIYRRLTV